MRMKTPKHGTCDPIAPLELPHSLHAFHRVSETDELNIVRHYTIHYLSISYYIQLMMTGCYILQFFVGWVDDIWVATKSHLVCGEVFVMIYYGHEPCIPQAQIEKYVHILIFYLWPYEIYTVNCVVIGILCKCFVTKIFASFLITVLPCVVISYRSSGRLPYFSWRILELLQHG